MTRRDGGTARVRPRRARRGWTSDRFPHALLPARVVAATAWPGFVVGHMLAFGSPHGPGTPHGAVDVHLLEMGQLGQLLLGLAGLLATGLLLQSARHALRSDDRLPLRATVSAAAAVQVSLFALIEVAERGWAVAAALSDPAVATGLAVQAVVAAVAVAGLTLVTEAVRAVMPPHTRCPLRSMAAPLLLGPGVLPPVAAAYLGAAAPRAPPFRSGS